MVAAFYGRTPYRTTWAAVRERIGFGSNAWERGRLVRRRCPGSQRPWEETVCLSSFLRKQESGRGRSAIPSNSSQGRGIHLLPLLPEVRG